MADIVYRANLSAKSFPLLSELQGRTVILKGSDQNYVSNLVVKDESDKDIGVAQIFYAHNVVPTQNGYKSVGYTSLISASGTGIFSSVFPIYSATQQAAFIAVTTTGAVYVLNADDSGWTAVPSVSAAGESITTAFVAGQMYIYISHVGCYTYDFTGRTLTPVTLTGLEPTAIVGITTVAGYLVAYAADTIAWSSSIDVTDFTPSLATGAGSGSLEGVKGNIVTAVQVYGGVIFFASKNAVAAIYSGNSRYPFTFAEITGCGGLVSGDYVSYDVNSNSIYAYTTAGLQSVSVRQASTIFSDITDFLSGSKFEDFDELTNLFSVISVDVAVKKKLAVIASRYLVISYGQDVFTHALVVDLAVKQYGKLKLQHADCFEYNLESQITYELPKKSMAFLLPSGELRIVDFDIDSPNSSGVLICGKYQYTRTRMTTLQGVEIENVAAADTFSMHTLPSLNGKDLEPAVAGFLAETGGQIRSYKFRTTALNHSILLKGKFNATSLVLTLTVHGAR